MAKLTKKEEREIAARESALKNLRSETLSVAGEPTRTFNVGEQVQLGHIDETTIIEDYGDGAYLVRKRSFRKKGNQTECEESLNIVSWLDLLPLRTSEEEASVPSFTEEDNLFLNFSQRDVDGLFSMVYKAGVDFDPDYQRGREWDDNDREALLTSIFQKVDIGKFMFGRRSYEFNGPLYEVIDGKQRLTTLKEFYEGRFSYKGKTFAELSSKDRRRIESYPVAVAIVDEPSEEQVLRYFLRMNSGGKPHDPEHLAQIKERLNKLTKT